MCLRECDRTHPKRSFSHGYGLVILPKSINTHEFLSFAIMGRQQLSQLRRNIYLLKALQKASAARRREILKGADIDFVETVCACCRNILNGNIPITEGKKRTLAKHKKLLRNLADPAVPGKTKKAIVLKQKGGFFASLLPAILGPVLGAVGSTLLK